MRASRASLRASGVPWGCVRSVAVELERFPLRPRLHTPSSHPSHTTTKSAREKVGETSFSSGGGGVYRLAGSRKSPRWTLPLGQPSCLAGSSDPQRRCRPQVLEDELRRCCSTQVHTAARTPHPPTTQPPNYARAFGTDRARAAPPQEPTREPMGSCSTPTRRSVAQPRLRSSRSELA